MQKIFSKFNTAQLLLLSFLFVIGVGSVLLMLPISHVGKVSFIDILFTSTSATCVTGLMTLVAKSDFTIFGQFIILALIQIGGLGLMSFVTLMMNFASDGLSLKEKLFIKDSLNKDNSSDIKQYLFLIFKYTFSIELIGFIVLISQLYDGSLYSIFQSLFLSISAFCNAGIDIFGTNSLINYQTNIMINMVICVLIVLGGIGFMVMLDIEKNLGLLIKRKKEERIRFKVHTKIVLNLTWILIVSGLFLILCFEYNNVLKPFGFLEKLELSLFNSVTLRTAGFSTFDYSLLLRPTKILMIIFMLIGASPGGTGGGMKTTTFFLLIYSIYSQYKKQEHMVIYKHHVKKSNFIKATSIFFTYLIFIFISMLVLTAIENIDTLDLLFEAISAIGTVGLSTGITGILSGLSKLVIIMLMFVGRIGPITIAILFAQNNTSDGIKYPSAEIMVG